VNIKTSTQIGSGTDANVFLTIRGQLASNSNIQLTNSETFQDKFESGQTDVFRFKFPNMGNIVNITLTLFNFKLLLHSFDQFD
jgi:hypothetical protein